jgi:glycosyltransferase involved in cell wall biosynthesis
VKPNERLKILVVDGNLPWVRSLMLAMPQAEVDVYFLRILNVKYALETIRDWRHVISWRRVSANSWEKYVFVPGWTRFAQISKWVTLQACPACFRKVTDTAITVFTMPHYRQLPGMLAPGLKIYYVHDTLGSYGWDFEPIITWEKEMVSRCDAIMAVSDQVTGDFRKRTNRPVRHSPNAVTQEFVEELANGKAPIPSDMVAIPRPIVGCTGQVNHSYDWLFIGGLADALPDVSFVFVGPRTKASAETSRQIDRVLERKNVFWLGPKPHSDLPQYLASFDICLNPLAINKDNDRRCPLRLFDYMATDKPILSTSIAEALLHRDHIACMDNVEEAARWIKEMAGVKQVPNAKARNDYIRNHTWAARAASLLKFVEELSSKGEE